jgi:transcription initiation factor TFIIIB Brf1 subunit/transcription initiation factor TFIIB
MAECEHLREIIDLGESSHVCCDCGLVLDKHYEIYQAPLDSTKYDEWAEQAKDILDRYHISTNYYSFVMEDFNSKGGRKSMEKLLFSIYKVLNSLGVNVSLHDLSLSTGVSLSKIYSEQKSNENVCIDLCPIAERYCTALNLDFQTKTVIKEMLSMQHESGHTPSTIVAGTIFKVCKKNKLNISIKKISEVSNVSCISIQRFKNAFP